MDNQVMINIIEDILKRTDGKWENFTLSDKMILKTFYTNMLQEVERCLPVMRFWRDLKIEDEILKEKNPEMNKLNWLVGKDVIKSEFQV